MPIWNRIGNFVAGRKDPNTGRRVGGMAGAFRDADGNFTTPQQALISNIGRRIEQGSINRNIARDNRNSDASRQEMIASESRGFRTPPVLGSPAMPGPVTIPNPRDTSVGLNDGGPRLSSAELQQQQAQFDRYKDDTRSIYYQGGSARDPMPGPASRHRSPVRETYERSQAMTGSGDGFAAAKEHYRSLMQSRRDIRE